MDLHDEIEHSLGAEPPLVETDLVGRGRRALRWRRLAAGGSVVAVTAVALVAAAIATHRPAAQVAPAPAAAGPTVGTTNEPSFPPAPGTPVIRDPRMPSDAPVGLEPDGLHLAPGIEVVELWDDPWQVRPDAWSVALGYDDPEGTLTWWVGFEDARFGSQSASVPAANAGDIGFRAWAVEQKTGLYDGPGAGARPDPTVGLPGATELQLVRFDGTTERLTPLDGVTVLQQRAHPDLPDAWATADDRSAAAEVRFEGERYYVLARTTPGDVAPQYVAVPAAPGGTLDDFVELVRSARR